MIEVGVDEITLVLQLSNKVLLADTEWSNLAEDMVSAFENNSNIVRIFGERSTEKKAPAGYTTAYKYGEHSFYFAVAYHEYQHSMGVVIKFSAQSLDYFLEKQNMMVYQLLQKVSCKKYTQRLSRIDLTVDFIDEDVNITNIYQDLINGSVSVFREQISKDGTSIGYRKVPMKFKSIMSNDEVATIYVGSEKSNSRLRIYNKRKEQLETKGTKLHKALQCDEWIRFESVFRNEYAHQLSEELMYITSDDEYINLIATVFYQKYLFMDVDNGVAIAPTIYTEKIKNLIDNGGFKLKSNVSRNYELAKSIAYIYWGSGTMNTLYKVKEIWGKEAVAWILENILEYVHSSFIATDDCRYWIRENKEDYKAFYPYFDVFISDNLKLIINNEKGGEI